MKFFACTKYKISSILFLLCTFSVSSVLSEEQTAPTTSEQNLFAMDIEDLLQIEVTSVGKKEQLLSDTAAAIYVITQSDIRQSGATSIPEALRMAPGIEVARIDANKWAITSRGFNSRFANKLLVMIDGRTVYTPSFSGVYWEVQDTVLEDIERIEVIRGPGATLWGANAVNGVINIITKNTMNTQGTLASISAGTHEEAFGTLRYGAQIDKDSYGKAYVKGFKRDNFEYSQGGEADDDWNSFQTGGRYDSQLTGKDQITLQGDFYNTSIAQVGDIPSLTPPFSIYTDKDIESSGANILARWQHTTSLTSNYTLQAYFDHTSRDEAYSEISHNIFDVDFQHRFSFQQHHDIIWGLGYRFIEGKFDLVPGATLIPEDADEHLYNFFIQDEITLLANQLWLTIGSKFEHNDYTQWEVQPSIRLFWNIDPKHKVWSAISNAARTPSRYEYNSSILISAIPPNTAYNPTLFPHAYYLQGNKDIKSEEVTSYELGYRLIPNRNLSVDISLYYSEYDHLHDFEVGSSTLSNNMLSTPLILNNKRSGYNSGIEIAAQWQPEPRQTWELAYNYYEQTINTPNSDQVIQNSPHQNLSLRSNFKLTDTLNLNLWLKYTDEFENYVNSHTVTVDSYTTLDARLAWQINRDLEFSLVGQNLLESEHLEYIESDPHKAVEIERGFYIKLLWQY